jgi:hypothetical protein
MQNPLFHANSRSQFSATKIPLILKPLTRRTGKFRAGFLQPAATVKTK